MTDIHVLQIDTRLQGETAKHHPKIGEIEAVVKSDKIPAKFLEVRIVLSDN